MRSEGFYVNKIIPLTLAGLEPATFRFVAQHLNHCALSDCTEFELCLTERKYLRIYDIYIYIYIYCITYVHICDKGLGNWVIPRNGLKHFGESKVSALAGQ